MAKARHFLDAFARGDGQAMGDFFADDLAWHVAGSHQFSGDHRGKLDLVEYFCQLRAGADHTYVLTAESVLATDYHTALFTRTTAQREGRSLDVIQAHALTVRSDGLWREYWVCADDQDAEDAFWA
ncbi:MAG TPA: nuclear transport factor 2 family protein [Acidimicrobiales bacterium]|nr:nuclear transport factor 2 family protein [Acidimicrobiales bacterium]